MIRDETLIGEYFKSYEGSRHRQPARQRLQRIHCDYHQRALGGLTGPEVVKPLCLLRLLLPVSFGGWRRAGRTPGSPQSFVDARVSSFQVPACFCQFIRMCRLVELFLPSATVSLSAIQ